jgi:hypothetical protein
MTALRAGINAGDDSRTVEFVSTRDAATMNARMKVRQFTLGTVRVACHLSLASFQCPDSAASGIAFDAESRNLKRAELNFPVGMGVIANASLRASYGFSMIESR